MNNPIFDLSTPCVLWPGWLNRDGYGVVALGGRSRRAAHRVLYELFVGPVPEGLVLDHRCTTPACVNFRHLEPTTIRANTLRGRGPAALNALRTHCAHGHPLNEENTYFAEGRRRCRQCTNRRQREYQDRKRARESTPGAGGGAR